MYCHVLDREGYCTGCIQGCHTIYILRNAFPFSSFVFLWSLRSSLPPIATMNLAWEIDKRRSSELKKTEYTRLYQVNTSFCAGNARKPNLPYTSILQKKRKRKKRLSLQPSHYLFMDFGRVACNGVQEPRRSTLREELNSSNNKITRTKKENP